MGCARIVEGAKVILTQSMTEEPGLWLLLGFGLSITLAIICIYSIISIGRDIAAINTRLDALAERLQKAEAP